MAERSTDQITQAMQEATGGRSFRRWYWAIRALAIAVPVIGALPTAMNLYYSFRHDIPFTQVSHKLRQHELWVRNGECRPNYREIGAAKGAKVNVGACPTTGDISIKVVLASGRANYEWIALDQLQQQAWLGELLFPGAHAAEGPAPRPDRAITLAQAGGPQVVCQGWQSSSQIVRVVNEGGKCFRETISAFKGGVEKREEVPCNTQCPKAKQ